MKKILIAGCTFLTATIAQAQQTEGKVTYTRTQQMRIQINHGDGGENMEMPRTRTDNFVLQFGNNKSLWKQAEKEMEDEGGGGGMQIMMIGGGTDDVLYYDFAEGKRVEQREMFEKKFIIDDSLGALKWKITGETKTILNHPCMKATATQISSRTMMNINNGNMERKQVEDTSVIVAWFASDIPVPAGPAEYQGKLPGLILEMDVANGRQTFVAKEISPKADLASIKAPTGKKHYTREEYRKEVAKMMDEMQQNGGGNFQFRVRN